MKIEKPDLVVLLGDNVYESDSSDINEAYRDWGSSPSFQSLYTTVPIIATLDDNDYTAHYETGKAAFLEFFQVSATDERWQRGRGVQSVYNFGEDLQLILLDARYYHDASKRTLLGNEQWKWLEEDCFLDRNPRLRILVSPIQVLPTEHQWDCWFTQNPMERSRLLDWIRNSPSRTIIVSGDRHVGAIYTERKPDDDDSAVHPPVEMTTSSLTHSVSPPGLLDDEVENTTQLKTSGYIYDNNFGSLQIDWRRNQAVLSLHRVCDRVALVESKFSF